MRDNYNKDPNERIEAVWCIDSETGDEVLLDRLTSTIVMRRPSNTQFVGQVTILPIEAREMERKGYVLKLKAMHIDGHDTYDVYAK